MPYQSNSRLADLILQQGQIAADRAQRTGDLWASVVHRATQLPDRIGARKAAEQDAAMQRRQQEAAAENAALQRQVLQGNLTDQARGRQQDDDARAMATKTQKVSEWLGDIASNEDPDVMRAAYRSGRDSLIQAGVLTPQDAPEFFPGQTWVRSRMTQLLPIAERFKQMFPVEEAPEPFTLGPGQQRFGPDGTPIASVPEREAAPSNPTEASLAAAAARGDQSAVEALRLLRAQNPPNQATTEPGWTLQSLTDPATNQTRMVRVNSRTGEVQPVALPDGLQPGGQRTPRLTAGQQDDLSTLATVEDLITKARGLGEEIGWKGVGAFGTGTFSQLGMNLGLSGTSKEETLRNYIGNIQATIAKMRGGTSFTPNEQKMLDSYTPRINDSDSRIQTKLNSLAEFIQLRRANTLRFAGGGNNDPNDALLDELLRGGQ